MVAPKSCKNPEYYNLLEKWYLEAKERGSNYKFTLQKALDSLKKYPSELSLSQLVLLPGIGAKTVARLEKELNQDKEGEVQILKEPEWDFSQPTSSTQPVEENVPPISKASQGSCTIDLELDEPNISQPLSETLENPKKRKTKAKPTTSISKPTTSISKPKVAKSYVPRLGSGGYAILLGLLKLSLQSSETYFPQGQVIKTSQPFAEQSLTQPGAQKYYHGFSSITTLLKHDLVFQTRQPTCYGLTETGRKLARQLVKVKGEMNLVDLEVSFPDLDTSLRIENFDDNENNTEQILHHHQLDSEPSSVVESSTVELEPGSFEIIMLVDNREKLNCNDRDYFSKQLNLLNVQHEIRPLPLGDFLWIAKPTQNIGSEQEVVLDYIVERKANSDLADSIKDGRYYEQKGRLVNCGCRKVIYLLEAINYNDPIKFKLPVEAYWTATAQLLDHNFSVKHTTNIDQSIQFLKLVTEKLKLKFQNRHLAALHQPTLVRDSSSTTTELDRLTFSNMYLTYPTFKSYNKKSFILKVQDIFKNMLTSTPYLTQKKALNLLQKFPTPAHLIHALEEKENLKEKVDLLINNHPILTLRIQNRLAESLVETWSTK